MDCTYKTNKYKMPLLDIVGVTAMNTTYFVGFAFVSDEQQSSYEFVLRCLEAVCHRIGVHVPETIISDKDTGLLNALGVVLPATNSMICVWHINRDILKKARPILRMEVLSLIAQEDRADPEFEANLRQRVDEQWRLMLGRWMVVVNARTENLMEEAWQQFEAEYSDEAFRLRTSG